MALIKSENQREIDSLKKIEAHIERRERRERIYHVLIGGLGFLAVASYVTGHLIGAHHKK
ncbi:MAG: hypothetical protein J6C78_06830 [Muribaculaceae bacterium]|nr:hypothetical protein [Muribaculaceae bacterium]